MREELLEKTGQDRSKVFESFLANTLSRYAMTHAAVKDLDNRDKPLTVEYSFESPGYGRSLGGLLLVRPRVLGQKASPVAEGKPRKFPVEFHEGSASESDIFDIKLPPGSELDELPAATDAVYDFAEYHSHIEMKDGMLHYERTYTIKDVLVPLEKMDGFKKLMRQISGDEQATAVFRRNAAASGGGR
jgi:hypothetical protein